MFLRFLLIILISCSGLLAQQKYLVYFKDKGIVSPDRFFKSSAIENLVTQNLTAKSIERRKQVMGETYYNYDDIPVHIPYKQQIENLGIVIDKTLNWFNAVSCYLNSDNFSRVQALPFVEKIEPVKILGVKNSTETDFDFRMYYSSEPALKTSTFDYGLSLSQNNLSDVPKAHDAGLSGKGVIIGVLDTGFEISSRAFNSLQIIDQHDFVFNDDYTFNQSGDVSTQHNHGTAVLSIMAGMDNGVLIGPAYGAGFLLAKTEDVRSETHIEEDNYASALEWMEARGVMLTSSSLGYNIFDTGQTSYSYQNMDGKTAIVTKAAELAFQRGVVVMTAAGNEGANSWHYIIAPGDGFNTITVGALTPEGVVAGFSSRGPTYDGRIKPEVCAQGVNVFHALPLSTLYSSGAGTSYATPMAAGITALLLEANPYLTNVQVRSILMQSGDNTKTPDNNRGYGLLSAVKMLNMPNLKKNGAKYEINKMFVGRNNIIPGTVRIDYSVNSVIQTPVYMAFDGVRKYKAVLPEFNNGDQVRFSISYNSAEGIITTPYSDYYEFVYGQMVISDKSYGAQPPFPSSIALYQNFPNPFVSETTIRIDLTQDADVKIDIYNMLGQKMTNLYSGSLTAGAKKFRWDGRNNSGGRCASGVYIYTVEIDGRINAKKMILVK